MDEVYSIFARIHADYMTAIEMALRNLPDDDMPTLVAAVDAHNVGRFGGVSFKDVPDELYPLLPRLRPLIRREVARRIEAGFAQEAGS